MCFGFMVVPALRCAVNKLKSEGLCLFVCVFVIESTQAQLRRE